MAWTDLSPYALAQVLHAADMNEIRLNLAETAPGIATAAGQLFYANGANSLDVLGISNGRILRAGANAPYYDALLTAAPTDLTDNSDDGEIPTFGALRETFLAQAQLYARLITSGQAMTPGTTIDIDLPSGKAFSDYRWAQFLVGETANDLEGPFILPVGSIQTPSTSVLYMASNTQLYTVNVATGVVTARPNAFGVNSIRGIASHGNILYGVDSPGYHVYTIDPSSGIAALAVDADPSIFQGLAGLTSHLGILYTIDIDGDIYEIDIAAETWTLISMPTKNSTSGIASHSGALYGSDNARLYTIDLPNRTTSNLPNIYGNNPLIGAATGIASHEGTLYVIANRTGDDYISTVDPATGLATDLAMPYGAGLVGRDLSSHGGPSTRVGTRMLIERHDTNTMRLYPTKPGYLHEVAVIL